jgi:thiol-disulfide isomerase/thioredoxin
VLVELYTDGPDAASEENVKFETSKFGTIATPFYAILDANENVVTTFDRRTTDPQEYLAFLNKGATAAPATPAAPVVAAAKAGDLPQVTKLDGAALDAASLSGKVVVVNFWATWCVPCVGEIPGFNKVSREYGSKGVVVVGVAMDEEGLERVQPFLKKHPMDYTVALGSPAISTQYNLGELPVTVVFDRSGKQLKRFEGFTPAAEIQSAIQQAL